MTADFLVVLDACVLIPAPLRDTLLRLAEHPRLYVPRWSETIIAEVVRNLEGRIGLSVEKTAYLVAQLREHFGDSWVTGYEPLIDRMANDPGDRHVLAAAVKCGAPLIVTYNKRHFPTAATEPWDIEVQGPSAFLKSQYDLNPSVVIDKLHAQARNLGRTLPEQLAVLRKAVLRSWTSSVRIWAPARCSADPRGVRCAPEGGTDFLLTRKRPAAAPNPRQPADKTRFSGQA